MNFVEPIRDKNLIDDICTYLKNKNKRDCILFMCGIYVGLRVSDLLKFKVKDLKGRRQICILEQKTGKQKIFSVPDEFYPVLNDYLETRKDDEIILKLTVSQDDMGKVIGKQGRIAKAIRTVVRSAANREKVKVSLEIV